MANIQSEHLLILVKAYLFSYYNFFMAQKSCLYLNHRPQGQMHYLILNSKICEVAHSTHSNSPQPTFPSCHGPDMNPNSPWRREEEVGGLGSLLPTSDSPSGHTCFTDVNIYLIVHPTLGLHGDSWSQVFPLNIWWQTGQHYQPSSGKLPGQTGRCFVLVFCFFSFKNQDYWGKKKTKLDKARIRWDWFLLFCWGSLWSHSSALMMG